MNRIKSVSDRWRLIRELDKLFSQLIAKERGPNCEIHNKPCSQTGNMHILSKQAHPDCDTAERISSAQDGFALIFGLIITPMIRVPNKQKSALSSFAALLTTEIY